MDIFPKDYKKRTMLEQAEFCSDWLMTQSSINVNPSSRILELCRIVKDCAQIGQIGNDNPTWIRLIQAKREIQELDFVIQVLGNRLMLPPFREKIELLVSGSITPELLTQSSVGRDTHFELYCASIFARAGLSVDHPQVGTADWEISDTVKSWICECKRVGSETTLIKRIKKAAKQINGSQKAGVICMDLSRMFDQTKPISHLDRHVSEEQLADAGRRRDEAFLANYKTKIIEAMHKTSAGTFIFHDAVLNPAGQHGQSEVVPWTLTSHWACFNIHSPGTNPRLHLETLTKHFFDAMPGSITYTN